ncbi:fasciclin-like arabinogalactan protein 6 [Phoenix dactylifera]|uniref:Fasciclin-like arabinogalactan protein 6 n=1 Tax=Phoenix dactylifera TaxID=42345 RepID=A0A8B7BQE0_PHODC|nr:fasciclin-like arabinogalactan protein 6 [Phoenix dactylifera]
MASSLVPLPSMFIGLTAIFLLITAPHVLAQAKAPVAPGPTAGPLSLTAILEKSGQYTTLLRLLKVTQVGEQVQSQLNNSYDGLTIFAPTDNAFSSLKSGALNSLNPQEQVSLVLYHVLPRYYSLTTFQTASNPVRTQASGSNGAVYTVNVTTSSNQANVSTGVDETPISNALYSEFPLAVYSIDKVLLPYDLFGPKPPAPAPAPVPKKHKKAPAAASGPTSEAETTPSAASLKGSVGWGFVMGVGLMSIASLL